MRHEAEMLYAADVKQKEGCEVNVKKNR